MPRIRFLLLVAALAMLGACGGSSDTEKAVGGPTIVVGSNSFTESETLAQIYGGALKNAGATVEYKLKQGNREITGAALESGQIDMMPEYVGNYLAFLDKNQTNGLPLPDAVAKLRESAKAKSLTIGQPSEAADGDVLAVTKDLANSKGLAKVSDLQKLGPFKLAGPTECETRQTCLLGLKSVYGLNQVTFLSTAADAGGPITKKALTDGNAQVGRLFSSDPDLAKSGKFVVLEDDKSYQQAGNIVPVIRTPKATEALVKVLDKVSKALTNDKLLEINKKTDVDKEDPAKVASDFVLANKL